MFVKINFKIARIFRGIISVFSMFCAINFLIFSQFFPGANAAELRFGINAEVSYKESESDVKRRYSPFLDELGRVTGHKFVFFPVYSDRVGQAVGSQQYDLLLIHTHLALKAVRDHKFQVIGFTDDRKNDQVYFFVRSDSDIKTLGDMVMGVIGVPGMQSWATATARSTLKSATGASLNSMKFEAARFQEAVPIMLELHKASTGITRSKILVDEFDVHKKFRVVHVTPHFPLNTLIASESVPLAVVDEIRSALMGMGQSKIFESMAFKGVRYSQDEHRNLADFYQ